MHGIWIDVRSHGLASTLFLSWWFILTLMNFVAPAHPEGSVEQIHLMLPVFAGGLICWWRKATPARITGGTLGGAAVLLIDVPLQLSRGLFVSWFRGKPWPAIFRDDVDVEVLLFAAIAVVIGAALGFVGASVAAGIAYLEERSQNAAPHSPPARETVRAGARRILPEGAVLPGVALVLVVAAILAPDAFGRYSPPFASKVNVLVAVLLLAPISRWNSDAGKALSIVLGLLTLLLGSMLLIGAAFTLARGPGTSATVLFACAIAQIGAGVLVFRAAFRPPRVHHAT